MLTLRGTAFFKPVSVVQSGTRSFSSSFSSTDDEPIGASSKHNARENRQRVAEGALHNATPALKGVANVYTKKGRAAEGSYFVCVQPGCACLARAA